MDSIWSNIWSVLVTDPCASENNIYSVVLGGVFYKYLDQVAWYYCLIPLYSNGIFFIFYQLLREESWNFPSVIVSLSISISVLSVFALCIFETITLHAHLWLLFHIYSEMIQLSPFEIFLFISNNISYPGVSL